MSGRASYWRSVALVFSGTATAQLIPILGSLLIARIFAPADFGMFMTWLGMVSLAAVFSTGRFEMALALEPNGPERAQAATAAFATMGLVLLAIFVPGAVIYALLHARLQHIPLSLVALYAPAVAGAACALIFQAWAAAEGRFRALSAMRITQAVLVTGLQIGAGFAFPSAWTLAAAQVVGVLGGLVMMCWLMRPPRLHQPAQSLAAFWSRHRRFPIYALPADTVNTAAAQLPLTIIAHRFGAETAGFVALAFRLLGAPISLMGSAVLDVFKRRASESWRSTGSCRGPYLETLLVLATGSLIGTAAFWFVGERLFVIAFGVEWVEAGRAAVILLPLFALRFVASPLSYTFYIAQKQPVDLVWQICLFAMTLTTLTAFSDYQSTLAAYAYGYGVLYVIYIALSYRFSAGRIA